MRTRLISAAVLVPVVGVLFVIGDVWLALGIAVLSALVAFESARLFRQAGLPAATWLVVAWTPLAVFFAGMSVEQSFELRHVVIAPGIALLVIVAAAVGLAQKEPGVGLRTWIGTVMGALYPAMLGFAVLFVGIGRNDPDAMLFGYPMNSGKIWLLILVATVWTLDSAAYVTGRIYPRGQFFHHISPNKTWSGAIGGTLAAIAVCTVLVVGAGMSVLGGLVVGLVIAVAAQLGDLTESMLKRAAGVKDSGTLIPGHGGFLDRVDSFLFAAPALVLAFWILLVVGLV
ncbi:MAG TPA: phosphatidate cytidylyltransferase [Candidatus Limnocylindria bacterium]|nr:phosphatidate cytidylyltransferase [Candidatus Limnocylindria bacterium]